MTRHEIDLEYTNGKYRGTIDITLTGGKGITLTIPPTDNYEQFRRDAVSVFNDWSKDVDDDIDFYNEFVSRLNLRLDEVRNERGVG